jgi:hypothetical protein
MTKDDQNLLTLSIAVETANAVAMHGSFRKAGYDESTLAGLKNAVEKILIPRQTEEQKHIYEGFNKLGLDQELSTEEINYVQTALYNLAFHAG